MKSTQILTVFFILLLTTISCNSKKYYKVAGYTQGTTYHITYQGTEDYESAINELLHQFDMSLSTYVDSSIISRINKNEKDVKTDKLFKQFFEKSREVYDVSGGYFDITVAPLVNAYGFGFTNEENVDSLLIDSIMVFIGMNKVSFENGKVIKSDPRVMLDGNAIAQGQSVDYIADFLKEEGVINYLVEIGGEITAKGINDRGESWRVGVDKPIVDSDEASRELQAVISLKNRALATSGNYRKFYVKDGVKYGHTINPKTGKPAMQTILSATILADDCITADAYATACMVVGLEGAKKLLTKLPELDAYLIYTNRKDGSYQIFMTDGIKGMLEELD